MERHILQNAIEWNRKQLDHAMRDRNSDNPERAIAACRKAQRLAINIASCEEKLNVL